MEMSEGNMDQEGEVKLSNDNKLRAANFMDDVRRIGSSLATRNDHFEKWFADMVIANKLIANKYRNMEDPIWPGYYKNGHSDSRVYSGRVEESEGMEFTKDQSRNYQDAYCSPDYSSQHYTSSPSKYRTSSTSPPVPGYQQDRSPPVPGYQQDSEYSCSPPGSSSPPFNMDSYYSNSATGNLIVNYIPPNLTEEELHALFSSEGQVENVKIVRKKPEGHSLGYAFVKYVNPGDAHKAICRLNGYRLQNKILKVSVARPSCPDIKDANLYISGIPKHLTQAHLHGTFEAFGKIVNCKIITDGNGQSRGIGFVRYNTKQEAVNACQHLDKTHLPGSSVPLQVKLAEKPSHRNLKAGMYDEMNKLLTSYKLDPESRIHPDVNKILKQYFPDVAEEEWVTESYGRADSPQDCVGLYVYNLPAETDKNLLYSLFQEFGEIMSVRPIIHYPTQQCKGFGFVNMKTHLGASLAIHSLHGKIINGKPLQVSFKK